jgi:hypothetical protein
LKIYKKLKRHGTRLKTLEVQRVRTSKNQYLLACGNCYERVYHRLLRESIFP